MGCSVSPSSTRSARISPTTLANLNPCPEHAEATTTFESSRRLSMTKCESTVFVYMHTFASRRSPFASGTRRRSHPRTRSSSSGDAVEGRFPAVYRLLEAQRRARALRETQVCVYAPLGREPSGLTLVDASPALEPGEQRVPLAERTGVEHFVIEPMTARALERAGDELTVGRPGVQATGLGQKMLAAHTLQLAPELPRAAEQRHVVGVLVIGEPDDPRKAAGGAEGVAACDPVEAEHRRPARRERVSGRAAVGAEPRHDDVRVHKRMVPHLCRVHRPV